MTGKLFVYPTDTVWGVGGSIFSIECYEKIALIKGHSEKKPLSIIFKNFEMIAKYIDLPPSFNEEWLNNFFKLESTLGLPKQWSKQDLPHWICQSSNYITIRCMDIPELEAVFREIQGPITSTSLNLTGSDPIINLEEAKVFFDKYMNNEVFTGYTSTKCSGRSSTIVLYDGKDMNIIREGKFVEEVREHFRILSA